MIAETSYDAAAVLAAMEFESSRISAEVFKQRKETIEAARIMMHKVDDIMAIQNSEERENRLLELKDEVSHMRPVVCDKNNLYWEAGSIWRNIPRVLTGLIHSSFNN